MGSNPFLGTSLVWASMLLTFLLKEISFLEIAPRNVYQEGRVE